MTKKIAVVLSGAVAQGAFEAGALKVLAGKDVQIVRIVSASAGSLNAVGLAVGVRARGVDAMADKLIELWQDHADWENVFSINPLDWIPFSGLSDQTKLLKLLEDNLTPAPAAPDAPSITLNMIVAPLAGSTGEIAGPDGRMMTTYEHMIEFKDTDFNLEPRLSRAREVAVASAAFPGVFTPYDLGDVDGVHVGPCVDGGSTNNTPIQYALRDIAMLDEILVINPTVATVDVALAAPVQGVGLASQIGQMLINERLYRDLVAIKRTNQHLAALEALIPNTLTRDQFDAVVKALEVPAGPNGGLPRIIDPVQIRPLTPLPGNAFSGFLSASDRKSYIEAGIACATEVLKDWPDVNDPD